MLRGLTMLLLIFVDKYRVLKKITWRFLLFSVYFFCAVSCFRKGSSLPVEEDGFSKVYERRPFTLTIKTDRKKISVAERINFSIVVEHDEGFTVEIPSFKDKLGDFSIVRHNVSDPKLTLSNTVVITHSFVLEPFLSGEYVIPSFTVLYWQKSDKEPVKQELTTEPLTISVGSLLYGKTEKPELNEIKGPVDLPLRPNWLLIVLSFLLFTGIIVVFILFRKRKREEVSAIPSIPPYEIALKELEALLKEDLIAKGFIKLFYQKISDIVRNYIENRFRIHAPERTTEEFMEELRSSTLLQQQYRPLLEKFLTHCDMVKFAKYHPSEDEILATIDSAKDFLFKTASSTQSN